MKDFEAVDVITSIALITILPTVIAMGVSSMESARLRAITDCLKLGNKAEMCLEIINRN